MVLASPGDMESTIQEALSHYVAEAAAKHLLHEALKGKTPRTPAEWAALVEGPLWNLLRSRLPFRSMPPELRALVATLKAGALEAGEEETQEGFLTEVIDLEGPEARGELIGRLAKLPGVLGVWVRGKTGAESRAEVPIPSLEAAHQLLTGYHSFYVDLEGALLLLRNLGQGYVALLARKEANLGQLLQVLRRLSPKEEEG
ncbi:MAG: hypothetical protein ACUVQD_06260 [Thermaceae bacterium]